MAQAQNQDKTKQNAYTQYLVIPSALVRNSQYPFKKDEEVEIIVDPVQKRVMIVSTKSR